MPWYCYVVPALAVWKHGVHNSQSGEEQQGKHARVCALQAMTLPVLVPLMHSRHRILRAGVLQGMHPLSLRGRAVKDTGGGGWRFGGGGRPLCCVTPPPRALLRCSTLLRYEKNLAERGGEGERERR